jgi:hypothetical protein
MSFGVCRMSVPNTETHTLNFEDYKNEDEFFTGENMGSNLVRPVQRISDRNGSNYPNRWTYFDGVYDLNTIVNWVQGRGRGKDIWRKRPIDWNSYDDVQWDNKPVDLDPNNVTESNAILTRLRNTGYTRPLRPLVPVNEIIGIRADPGAVSPQLQAHTDEIIRRALAEYERGIRVGDRIDRSSTLSRNDRERIMSMIEDYETRRQVDLGGRAERAAWVASAGPSEDRDAMHTRLAREHRERANLRGEMIAAAVRLNQLFPSGMRDHDGGLGAYLFTYEYQRLLDAEIGLRHDPDLIEAKEAFVYAYRQLRDLYAAQGRELQ